jgi:hypothetical protein
MKIADERVLAGMTVRRSSARLKMGAAINEIVKSALKEKAYVPRHSR